MEIETNTQTIQNYNYDLFVIGGGSGGIKTATTASKLGAKVAVADYVKPSEMGTSWGLGGTCVNVGCIPKYLFHSAANLGDLLHDQRAAGFNAPDQLTHNWETMTKKVHEYIRKLNWDAKLTLTQLGVKYYNKLARFVDQHTVELYDPKHNTTETVTAKNIVISVGGRPTYLENIDPKLTMTSDDIFFAKKNPGKTLVVGAGYVSLESAGFLNGLGCDVTVMVRSVLLRSFDQDAVTRVGKYMENKGVKFITGAIPDNVSLLENGQRRVSWGTNSEDFDTVLVAIGRTANTKYLNLEAAGVKYDPRNLNIYTNDVDATNVDNIYAIGDCAFDRPELTSVAVMAGSLLASRLFSESTKLMNYKNVASTVFTPLEYGFIGYSEKDAISTFGKDNIVAYHSTFKPLDWIYNDNVDLCYIKMVCLKENEKIIGLHYVGPNSANIMQGYSVALNLNATRQDFIDTVAIHPSYSEELLDLNILTSQDPLNSEGCKNCGL